MYCTCTHTKLFFIQHTHGTNDTRVPKNAKSKGKGICGKQKKWQKKNRSKELWMNSQFSFRFLSYPQSNMYILLHFRSHQATRWRKQSMILCMRRFFFSFIFFDNWNRSPFPFCIMFQSSLIVVPLYEGAHFIEWHLALFFLVLQIDIGVSGHMWNGPTIATIWKM